MLTILQQPQALTFVGNIPDLIAQTDGLGMSVNISKGATLILAEYYTADADGRTRIPLREFLEDQLQLQLPTGELFEQTKSVATFTIEIISGTDSLEITFVAIAGGSSTLALDCPAYLLEAWLTWQPQVKRVKDIQPEWLSYFAQYAGLVKVKAYFPAGVTETITLHTLAAAKHYTLNATFADLRLEFVDQPIYIDIWIENLAGAAVVFSTYRQRYVLSTEFFEFDDFFLFKNSVGGIDTIRFTGERQATNPIEIDTALFMDEFEQDYQVNPRLAFEKNTGWFRSRAELLWTMDFFQSVEKYYYTEEAFAAIRLINPEFTAPEYILTSLDFKFSYTRQTVYLSLFKKKSPLIDPIIIGPGDDLFYLPPTISDFPQQTDPSGLLFPVQKPGTPGWFFITWANMLADVLANLSEAIIPPHNQLEGIQGGIEGERYHLTLAEKNSIGSGGNNPNAVHYNVADGKSALEQTQARENIDAQKTIATTIVDALEAGSSPATANPFVTVSALNSYAYVQEAAIDGIARVRLNGAWSHVSPYHLKQEGATDGQAFVWSNANSRYQPGNLAASYVRHDINTQGLSAGNQLNARTNIGAIGGAGVAGQVAFWNGTNNQIGDSGFVWDNVNKRLGLSPSTPLHKLDFAILGSQTQQDYINFAPINGGSVLLGSGITWKANFTGYTKRSAGILQIPQANFFRSGIGFYTNNAADNTTDWTEKWRITMDGVLQSNGSQTIRTSTGNLTLETGAANGNVLLTPNGTGMVGIKTTPTEVLDVNGRIRIRTIDNGVGNFITKSATGVLQERTALETRGDIDVFSKVEVTEVTGELAQLNTPDKSNLVSAINQKGQYRSVGW